MFFLNYCQLILNWPRRFLGPWDGGKKSLWEHCLAHDCTDLCFNMGLWYKGNVRVHLERFVADAEFVKVFKTELKKREARFVV